LKTKAPTMVASHIENLGEMIEDNETEMRSNFQQVYLPKTHAIVQDIQKKPVPAQDKPPAVNPLMGMMMNSDVLKKRLAKQAAAAGE
jgi:hypothetical protein